MEIVVMLFVLFGVSIGFSAWKNQKSSKGADSVNKAEETDHAVGVRACRACGYEGEMKTWIANYTAPKIILVVGFLLGYLPGLIFTVMYWGKFKCPGCGAVGKNQPN